VGKDSQARHQYSLGAIVQLGFRCWPYYRPQVPHLLIFVLLNTLIGGMILGGMVLANDVVDNKILLGERLEPLQARALFLDADYVTSGAEDEPPLSKDQRRQVRLGVLVLGALYMILLTASVALVWYYMVWIFQRINQQLRVEMLARAERLSLSHHSQSRTGDAIYRVYQDSATITNVLQFMLLTPLRILAWFAFGMVVIVLFSPWLFLFMVAAGVPIYCLMRHYMPKIRLAARESREANSELTSRIQETLAAIRVIKASGAEDHMMQQFGLESQQALDAAYRVRYYFVLLSVGVTLVGVSALLVAEYLMATWALSERATYMGAAIALVGFAVWNLGAFKAATGRGLELTKQAREFAGTWAIVQDLVVGLERAFYLLDLEPEVNEPEHPKAFPSPIQRVDFDAVHFSYQSQQKVLAGVSLGAEVGTITAIVGSTGAGKSTLVSLLLRLAEPEQGRVTINGEDIREMATEDLRGGVSIALQQNILFAMSVADNIRYGQKDTDQQKIQAAARIACADEFIQDMPEGYDTELGERGGKLSTGQRQRLSIARAVLRDTPILILDEPTASLDAMTEQAVMRNLAEWGRGRVVFIITHRLSTIRRADQIAFLEDGVIRELGDHQSLMAQQGAYSRFVEAETGEAR
tara:strand:- start:2265 stop:4181 length:1917 start_codon:yes stop_codon:yes gene_type:complete